MDVLKWKLGFSCGVAADSNGRSGGIACLWNDAMSIQVLRFSRDYIDVLIENSWRCTGFYGNPVVSKRSNSWQLLTDLKDVSDLPWLVGGDFNEVLRQSEKCGGNLRPEWQMNNFQDALDVCRLQEIHSDGPFFTWKNNRGQGNGVFEKLDRVVVCDGWRSLFPGAVVTNVVSSISDHLPMLLDTEQIGGWQRGTRSFKFENFWVGSENCFKVIKESWKSSRGWNANVKEVQGSLKQWSKGEFGSLSWAIRRKQALLKEFLADLNSTESSNAYPASLMIFNNNDDNNNTMMIQQNIPIGNNVVVKLEEDVLFDPFPRTSAWPNNMQQQTTTNVYATLSVRPTNGDIADLTIRSINNQQDTGS
ncbi:hypothetical protein ACFE04_003890 [Oxalis oulophora]